MSYPNAHQYHIHSVSAAYDAEHFISSDETTVNLWSLTQSKAGQTVVNISPPNIDELVEAITHCEFHPVDSSIFVYSSTKGYFNLCDIRISSD